MTVSEYVVWSILMRVIFVVYDIENTMQYYIHSIACTLTFILTKCINEMYSVWTNSESAYNQTQCTAKSNEQVVCMMCS